AKRAEAPSRLRDPQGEILFGLVGGYTSVNGSSFGTAGVHLGYAALTGVVPGIRGTFFFGDLQGGQVVGTLWLTPPLDWAVVPFAVGEVGYVWQSVNGIESNGRLFGAGGGLHVGRRDNAFSLRAGVVYRVVDGTEGYYSPMVVGSFRL
ncbi:MAG: hypothetical protein AAFN74_26160, partial [Myxococcota bacterium]